MNETGKWMTVAHLRDFLNSLPSELDELKVSAFGEYGILDEGIFFNGGNSKAYAFKVGDQINIPRNINPENWIIDFNVTHEPL